MWKRSENGNLSAETPFGRYEIYTYCGKILWNHFPKEESSDNLADSMTHAKKLCDEDFHNRIGDYIAQNARFFR